LTTQAKVGIGVGVSVVPIASASLLIFMILKKRRRKEQRYAAGSTLSEIAEMKGPEMKVLDGQGTAIYEKDGYELHEAEQYGSQPPELREDPRSAVELQAKNSFYPEDEITPKK
jgi:hypothetical protein